MVGRLVIVSTPIGNISDFSDRAARTLQDVDIIACEDSRTTRKLLALSGLKSDAKMISYHDHNGASIRPKLLAEIDNGKTVALVSDAGTPLISDPGYKLVAECHERGFVVTPVPGPSAPLAALTISGLPTDKFIFSGFLPSNQKACEASIREISSLPMTIIWFETPKRLLRSLTLLANILGPRLAVVARELTKIHEEVIRAPLPDLIAQLQGREKIKGEVIILVEGRKIDEATFDVVAIKSMLSEELQHQSLRDAVQIVANKTKIQKRRIYQIAVELKILSTEK